MSAGGVKLLPPASTRSGSRLTTSPMTRPGRSRHGGQPRPRAGSRRSRRGRPARRRAQGEHELGGGRREADDSLGLGLERHLGALVVGEGHRVSRGWVGGRGWRGVGVRPWRGGVVVAESAPGRSRCGCRRARGATRVGGRWRVCAGCRSGARRPEEPGRRANKNPFLVELEGVDGPVSRMGAFPFSRRKVARPWVRRPDFRRCNTSVGHRSGTVPDSHRLRGSHGQAL